MKKKVLAVVLALTMVMGLSVTAFCENQEASTDGSKECIVTAEMNSTYVVSIPATLALTDANADSVFDGTYTVGAKGNIACNKFVEIIPDASFKMKGSSTGREVTATVTQTKTQWVNFSGPSYGTPAANQIEIGGTSFANSTGSVAVTITQADNYAGNLTFTYALKSNFVPAP